MVHKVHARLLDAHQASANAKLAHASLQQQRIDLFNPLLSSVNKAQKVGLEVLGSAETQAPKPAPGLNSHR